MIKWCQEACRKGLGTWGKCGSGKEEAEEKAGGRSLRGERKTDQRVSKQKKVSSGQVRLQSNRITKQRASSNQIYETRGNEEMHYM